MKRGLNLPQLMLGTDVVTSGESPFLKPDIVRLLLVRLDQQTFFRSRGVSRLWRQIINEITRQRPSWADETFIAWSIKLCVLPFPKLTNVPMAQHLDIESVKCACGNTMFTVCCYQCQNHPCSCDQLDSNGFFSCAGYSCGNPFCVWLERLCKKQNWCKCTRALCGRYGEGHARVYLSLK